MSSPSAPDDGGTAGRIRCLYCGASSLASVAACWQCGRSLRPLPSGSTAKLPQAQVHSPATADRPLPVGDQGAEASSMAVKAAVTLGLMFPYVAVPVGIVFLMLDDPRKARLAWLAIGWSIAGTAATAILFFATLAPLLALLKALFPQAGHGGLPDLHTPGIDPNGLNFWSRIF